MFKVAVRGGYNQIESPTFDLGAKILWDLPSHLANNGEFGTLKSLKLDQYNISEDELLLTGVANRDPAFFEGAITLCGRNITLAAGEQVPILSGVEFSALDFSGFGVQNFHHVNFHQNQVEVYADDPILVPSGENFYEAHPGVATWHYVSHGQILHGTDSYSFSGAYDLGTATKKIASTLEAARAAVAGGSKILTPIPMYLGVYDGIKNASGENAWFLAHLVPYEGRRTGLMDLGVPAIELLKSIIEGMAGSAIALKHMHNTMKVAHGSFLPSNYMTNNLDGYPPYVADWATPQRLNPRNDDSPLLRGMDLGKAMDEFWMLSETIAPQNFKKPHIAALLTEQFNHILRNYLGRDGAVLIDFAGMPIETLRSYTKHAQESVAAILSRIGVKDEYPPQGKVFNFDAVAENTQKILLAVKSQGNY